MGVEVRVEMQTDILRAIADAVTDPGFRDLAARALNATVTDAEGKTARLLEPFMPGLRPADITAALSTTPARPESLSASLVGGGKALPMIRFQPQASRAEGVTLTIAGKSERYRHAFLATVKHGHVGVFERTTRQRLPIRELYGPSVHGMMARTDVLPRITAELESDLLANLARQLDAAVRRAGGNPAGA